MQHEKLFEVYIFPLLCGGIEKQIQYAYEGDASARLMAAVALMVYTEFMGMVLKNDFEKPYSKKFKLFLRYMGEDYEKLLDDGCNVYDVFRSGLVHFFFVKGNCTIAMKNNPGPLLVFGIPPHKDIVIEKPVDIGIGEVDNGGYYFVVEKYYLDFKKACLRLYAERKGEGVSYRIPPTTTTSEHIIEELLGSSDIFPRIGDS